MKSRRRHVDDEHSVREADLRLVAGIKRVPGVAIALGAQVHKPSEVDSSDRQVCSLQLHGI